MKDNTYHRNLAETLENLSIHPLLKNDRKKNAPDYEQIPALIL